MKSRFLHCGLGFGIFHEGVPNEVAAMIFRHQHGDAKVDAQHVRVIPAAKWIESIDETVLLPHAFPVGPRRWRNTRMQSSKRNGREPPVAHGTMLPSIGPSGPP